MYDPILNRTFTMKDSKDKVWWEGEPIWYFSFKFLKIKKDDS
jgi:hypothetical protein